MLTPYIVLDAYSKGLFPMAKNRRDKQLFWIDPEVRGILPLDNFHIPRSLKKKIRNNPFKVQFDNDFGAVIRACAQQNPTRLETWINDEIIEVYTKLFNGGNAKLELVDADDPLEAGLELLVSPPGKRLQSITLLSGGEQALTALSLIFAVFLTNPSPICVLDEVDAPLDDANVTRFCNLLDELTKITSTRFIIVTHHALTMSKMDRLYGVTMPDKGISELVSVDLQKAESMVA